MSDRKKIISKHKDKIDYIKKQNKLYFIDDSPSITDSAYDKIKNEIIELEKKFPYLKKINCEKTKLCAKIERTFLNTLEGGCTAPIGAHSRIENDTLFFKGGLFSLDGKDAITLDDQISLNQSKDYGVKAAKRILNQGGISLLKKIKYQM